MLVATATSFTVWPGTMRQEMNWWSISRFNGEGGLWVLPLAMYQETVVSERVGTTSL